MHGGGAYGGEDAGTPGTLNGSCELVLDSVEPDYGSVGGDEEISIFGSGFFRAVAVTFDGLDAGFVVESDDAILATTPAHAPGEVTVSAWDEEGEHVWEGVFTYLE